jgi:hypothetical protein
MPEQKQTGNEEKTSETKTESAPPSAQNPENSQSSGGKHSPKQAKGQAGDGDDSSG